VAHLLTAYFSAGFFNLDEQTQVLNVVGHKLGLYDVTYLSSQYDLAIRSWFHPAIYLWCSKILLLFTPFNPFVHAYFYRLLSTILGLLSLGFLYKIFENELEAIKEQELFFFFSSFLWYFPFLHARPSNENICGTLFIFGLYFLKSGKTYKNFFFAGILLALSFVTRFQVIVMIGATFLWFLISFREYKKLLLLVLGFLLILGINTYFDSLMYGRFTFTPYNYFNLNIVQKYANTFGVTPWYQYFIYTFRECIPPLALIVIASFAYFWIRFPKHLLTSVTLPFFIVHSLIGHKEFRFLFPMAPFLPIILVLIVHKIGWANKKYLRNSFLVFNIPVLLYFSFTPAASTSRFFEFLYEHQAPVKKVYVFTHYEDNSKFYLRNDVEYKVLNSNEVHGKINSETNSFFLTMNITERDLILNEKKCSVTFSLYPQWIYSLGFIKNRRTFRSWSFLECKKDNI
jgi:phosphatidylinositol glycan class B